MLYYPQLTTGAVSQFPVARGTNMRTVVQSTCRAASRSEWPTPAAQKVQWQLCDIQHLTDGERSSIESLFEASEGQLNTFTFLDPTRQFIDVERGLDADGVDGRSVTAGERWSGGPAGRQRRDATYEHRANDATDYSEHQRAKFVCVLLQRVRPERRASDDSTGCDGDRTDLLTPVTTGAAWTE